ncbi:MAG: hypothetical protein WCQ95_13725 [Bacteroidota bacterium]
MSTKRVEKERKYIQHIMDAGYDKLSFPVIAYFYSHEYKIIKIIDFEVISSIEELCFDPDIYCFFLDSNKKIIDSTGQEYFLSYNEADKFYYPTISTIHYNIDTFKDLIRTWTIKQSKHIQNNINNSKTVREIIDDILLNEIIK